MKTARARLSLLLMVMSGFAGLGYQIVWTQQSALWLGHDGAAVLAVVAAFFGGVGAGAAWLGNRIARSPRPVRWYAGCEFGIAAWNVLLLFAMSPLTIKISRVLGVQPPAWHWVFAFVGTFVLLLPATAAMGATLPAMERLTAAVPGRSVAGLYAANTAGAVVGVLATAMWLVPTLGLQRTTIVCVALNVLCALACLGLRFVEPPPHVEAPHGASPRCVVYQLAMTGLLGIGYEVIVVRVLSQVTENTVYTFALMLAIYLVGTAAGAACYQGYHGRLIRTPQQGVDAMATATHRLIAALAIACLVGAVSLWFADRTHAFAGKMPSLLGALVAEALPGVLAFALPTFIMGALFSHLSRAACAAGISFGRALGVNTLAAAVAPALFGVIVYPNAGPKAALLVVVCGYVAVVAPWQGRRPYVWGLSLAVLVAALWLPRLAFIDVPEGGRVLSYEDGSMAAVSVVQDAQGVARLRINNRQQEGSSASMRVDGRQAWLPLLLHSAPHKALFLGLGTGVTSGSAAADPTLDVTAVELLPAVVAASSHFANGAVQRHVIVADARRFVRASEQHFDVIVSDNFHPARSGSGSLYTVEHFAAVRSRLNPRGLFCQWLPLHQMDLQTLRHIVKAFVSVYPQAAAVLASNSLETPVLGLVSHRDGDRFSAVAIAQRLTRVALPSQIAGLGFEDAFAVLGSLVAGPAALYKFARDVVANTDDRPVVAYLAPLVTYAPTSLPRDRLLSLLNEISVAPRDVLALPLDTAFALRLSAYWQARNNFITLGRDVRPSMDVGQMLMQVREPLLSVLQKSPDFRPAYDPLLAMAAHLAESDPVAARHLLEQLQLVAPERDEASRTIAALAVQPR